MSTQQRTHENGDGSGDDQDLFTATESVERVDGDVLEEMAAAREHYQSGVRVFAVASRVGVLRTPDNSHEYEATAVLYLTADGREAVERFFSRGLSAAPRACIMPAEKLYQAMPDGDPHPLADQLAHHPEPEADR